VTGRFGGKAVGLDSLAQYLDMDSTTLKDQYEPFLTRQGYLLRGKSGRMASEKAYRLVKELGLADEDAA
jgi:Holliday junction DNA helicase RuvB